MEKFKTEILGERNSEDEGGYSSSDESTESEKEV